ncbi:MAG: hypothetical protein QXV84_02530 [Conexivisphaerales archaeon]
MESIVRWMKMHGKSGDVEIFARGLVTSSSHTLNDLYDLPNLQGSEIQSSKEMNSLVNRYYFTRGTNSMIKLFVR